MKNIVILGSTGSIGTQTLEVVDSLKNIKVMALTTNVNIHTLKKQIDKYKPKYAVITDNDSYVLFNNTYKLENTKVLFGMDGLIEVSTIKEVQIVINSLVGNVGLAPTIAAIKAGKNIGLANKETLVTAGSIIMDMIKEKNVKLYPIDSEHSAIFQCLQGNDNNNIDKILLTASGGPFRGFTTDQLANVTLLDALKHPNWSMGKKITIDSATMMNKGLEVIEAKWLFDLKPSQIEVVVHKESIIHSMVMYEDSSVIAQLGEPDMKVPIAYALTYPQRIKNNYDKLDLFKIQNLSFEKPNIDTFNCLKLAFDAIEIGGLMPTVLNGANEIAVENFLNEKIEFVQISKLIEKTMNAYINISADYTLENIYITDAWARNYVKDLIS